MKRAVLFAIGLVLLADALVGTFSDHLGAVNIVREWYVQRQAKAEQPESFESVVRSGGDLGQNWHRPGDSDASFAHGCSGEGCAPQPWIGETCSTPGHLMPCSSDSPDAILPSLKPEEMTWARYNYLRNRFIDCVLRGQSCSVSSSEGPQ